MLFRGKKTAKEGRAFIENYCIIAAVGASTARDEEFSAERRTPDEATDLLRDMFVNHDKLSILYQKLQANYLRTVNNRINVFGHAHNAVGTAYHFACFPQYNNILGALQVNRGELVSPRLSTLTDYPDKATREAMVTDVMKFANSSNLHMRNTMVIRMHNPDIIREYFSTVKEKRMLPSLSINVDGRHTWSQRGGPQTNNGINTNLIDADDAAEKIDRYLDRQTAVAEHLTIERPVEWEESFILGCLSTLNLAIKSYEASIRHRCDTIIKHMKRGYPHLSVPEGEFIDMKTQIVEYYSDDTVITLGAPPVALRKAASMKFDVVNELVAARKITVTLPRWKLDVKPLGYIGEQNSFAKNGIFPAWRYGREKADKWLTKTALKL